MENLSLNCPLCCQETFDSFDSLKDHLLNLRNKLSCPACEENFTDLSILVTHLDECKLKGVAEENSTPASNIGSSDESNQSSDLEKENAGETDQFFCEICNIKFGEMKKHLMEYHMGQEVVLESQDLDDDLENLDDSKPDIESGAEDTQDAESPPNKSSSEHIFLEHEVLNEDGRFYVKKFTKIDIVKPNQRQPILEHIVFLDEVTSECKEEDTVKNHQTTMKVYRCQDCNLRFAQYANFTKHDCSSKQGEVCEICSIHFTTKGGLTFHKRKMHGEVKPVKEKVMSECDVCHIVFPSLKSMLLHKRMHDAVIKPRIIDPPATYNIVGKKISDENDETFKCPVCEKEYNKKYEEVHLKSHSEKLFNCAICNKKFNSKNDLSMHAQVHGNESENKISCWLCKNVFMNEESLTDHMENHCENRKYACSFCGRKFLRPHEKVKHERIHTGHKPHICEVCGKGFRVSYCLTLHLRTHSGIRPYHCETCGKRFKSHSVFKHHQQIHSDARPYKCPHCTKTFKTSVQVAAHKNTHTKPFNCNVCNRPFATLYAVKLHLKSHGRGNNLIHQCHICGAEYARNYALRDHLLTHPEHTVEDLMKLQSKKDKKNAVSTCE